MERKRIVLDFDLGQICKDVLVKCRLISKLVENEAAEDIKKSIVDPESAETRTIINRAITEAFGHVKVACQRYLYDGRYYDDNRLERLVVGVNHASRPIEVQQRDDDGHLLYLGALASSGDDVVVYRNGSQWVQYDTGTVVTIECTPSKLMEEQMVATDLFTGYDYEHVRLVLMIPGFNMAVTDDLKSAIHKYATDYVLSRFLQDQHADKAAEYKSLAEGEDYRRIISDLNARERYDMRRGSWM